MYCCYLVSLHGERQQGEDADTDSEGGGEAVDTAVHWPEHPLSAHNKTDHQLLSNQNINSIVNEENYIDILITSLGHFDMGSESILYL